MNALMPDTRETIAIPNVDYRIAMLRMERAMRQSEGFVPGSFFPLKHTFAHGLYMREISVPAGYFVLTYIHKHSHPAFVLKGETSVVEEHGNRKVSAGEHFVTPAGTQRLCFCHTDTVWVTVHLNPDNGTDIEKIESDIYARHYNELMGEPKKEIDICQER